MWNHSNSLGPRCFVLKAGGYWKLAVWRWRGPTQTGVHWQTGRVEGDYCADFFFISLFMFLVLVWSHIDSSNWCIYGVLCRNSVSRFRTGMQSLKRDLKLLMSWENKSSSTWNLSKPTKWRWLLLTTVWRHVFVFKYVYTVLFKRHENYY